MSQSASRARVTFAIDARVSRVTIKVTASGVLSAFGHNPVIAARGLSGELTFVTETLGDAGLRIRLPADKLSVESGINEKDRQEIERAMHADVLESSKYPEIVCESTSVTATSVGVGMFSVQVSSRVTVHGVTRELGFPATVTVTGPMLRANGSFSIRQTDFGIKLVSVGGGVLKVKDELQCAIDIVARQQD